jgi:hypothetical protein
MSIRPAKHPPNHGCVACIQSLHLRTRIGGDGFRHGSIMHIDIIRVAAAVAVHRLRSAVYNSMDKFSAAAQIAMADH